MVNLAYPTAPVDFQEQLAVSSFFDGLWDSEISQTLRLARHKSLSDVLALALEIEAARQYLQFLPGSSDLSWRLMWQTEVLCFFWTMINARESCLEESLIWKVLSIYKKMIHFWEIKISSIGYGFVNFKSESAQTNFVLQRSLCFRHFQGKPHFIS